MKLISRLVHRLTLYQCRLFGHKRPDYPKYARLPGEIALCERCLATIELPNKEGVPIT